jgi:hypothetical protein
MIRVLGLLVSKNIGLLGVIKAFFWGSRLDEFLSSIIVRAGHQSPGNPQEPKPLDSDPHALLHHGACRCAHVCIISLAEAALALRVDPDSEVATAATAPARPAATKPTSPSASGVARGIIEYSSVNYELL